jgi:hypothetical protein
MNLEINSHIFSAPFTCCISGSSQSGKTTLLIEILLKNKLLIFPPPDRIVYFYAREQPAFDKIRSIPNLELVEGMPDADMFDSGKNNLIILDDMMDKCETDKSITDIFCVDCHHKNISTFLIKQSLFTKNKFSRIISLNCNYMIIFSNPRDRSQILYLARQVFPTNSKFMIESFEEATSVQHGYLFLDLTQATNNNLRVQSNILDNAKRIIYVPKKQ